MKKHRSRIAFTICVMLLMLQLALPAYALKDTDARTVRVGFNQAKGYCEITENGAKTGYGYELLQNMKLYSNWSYEYVGYDKGWSEIRQMLINGEIDIAISATKTDTDEELFDYSDKAVASSSACLLVRAGSSPYSAGKYETYNGMRVGLLEDSSRIEAMRDFAEENSFSYTPVYYKTTPELESAVLSGAEVDAVVSGSLNVIDGTRCLDRFDTQGLYIAMQKNNKTLLDEINYSLEQINTYNPGLYDSLYNKYYSASVGDSVYFTPEESAYISSLYAAGSPLSVTIMPDISPYSRWEDGAATGILCDIATEALERTGLPYVLVCPKSVAEYRKLVENHEIDLRLAALFDYTVSEKLGYTLTSPYYSTDVSRVTRKDSNGVIKTVAAVGGGVINRDSFPSLLRDVTLIDCNTVAECSQLLLDGKCDAVYLCTRSAQEVVFNDVTNSLLSVTIPQSSLGFSFGICEDCDSLLSSILEKAVNSLDSGDVAAMELKYIDFSAPKLSFSAILYGFPMLVVLFVIVLLLTVFAAVFSVFINKRRREEVKQNQRLKQVLEDANKASIAKSLFMSNMSHEIRTPLNAIIGYNSISSGALSAANDPAEYRHAAMKAMDCLTKSDIASRHLLTVINDVLDMSAIESGKIKISREPFDFKNMISALTVLFHSQASSKGISFDVSFLSCTEEWFVGDQMRINQVVTNLLSNAVKFTQAGGKVKLAIRQTEVDEHTAQIVFTVSDTGIGMSSEYLPNLWTPFEQADATISRRFGGTGLGLSITKNLVELMDGTIAVESELGKGSVFTVSLSLERMKQPANEYACDFSFFNVLVVDDDLGTCDYLKLLLESAGTSCTAVTSGKDAFSAVRHGIESGNPFNLCVVDWHMPDTNGIETFKEIREIAGPGVPVIITSAYDYSEIAPDAETLDIYSFIPKPLFRSTVMEMLSKVSGRAVPETALKPNTPDFSGIKILLAEDNKMNMEIANTLLSSWNFTVERAWNGEEAYNMYRSSPEGTYKAILMDLHMPVLDGYSATKMIREFDRPDAQTIPIIAMTADVFAEDVADALAAGMNAHIGKPIEKNILFDTLKKFCL